MSKTQIFEEKFFTDPEIFEDNEDFMPDNWEPDENGFDLFDDEDLNDLPDNDEIEEM